MANKIFGERLDTVKYKQRPSVYGIIFNKHGHIGVIKVEGKNKLFLPGGGKEGSETNKECLLREFKEEIGYKVKINNLITRTEFYSYCNPLMCYLRVIGIFYYAKLIKKIEGKVEEDHKLLWLEPEIAIKNMMLEHQAWAIKVALEKKRIEA